MVLVEPPPPLPPVGEPETQVKVAEMTFKESGRTCGVCFVPDGSRLNTQKLQGLVDQWKLAMPNTIISSDGGTVHPKAFASEKLCTLPSLKQFWSDALLQADRSAVAKTDREGFALDLINNVMFGKLVTIFASVLDAAAINAKCPNWLIVDRINAKSPAAELLIEAALAQTSSRPTILVIDALDRLQNFKGESGTNVVGKPTQDCINAFEKVKKGGIPLGTDDPPGCCTVDSFYNYVDYMDPTNFHELSLPRPAEKAHLSNPDGSMPNRVKWQYHYLQTFFGGGSHYIVLDSALDAPDCSSLGPFGYIAANGQAMMLPRLRGRIQAGEAMVLLHNTGGVTQAFASLRKGMLSGIPPPEPAELLENWLELVSPAAWCKTFGLPEIHMLKELHQRAPMLLKNTVVAVDVMKDGSEDVLSTLCCCFSGGGGVPELGLGEAEVLCLLTAWKRHMILLGNAMKFERLADSLQLLLYFLGVVTTVVAVLYGMEVAEQEKQDALSAQARRLSEVILSGAWDEGEGVPGEGEVGVEAGGAEEGEADAEVNLGTPLGLAVMMLPIAATAIGTIKTKLRPREKWAMCLMSAHQIVCEIYKYRLRTAAYDTMAPQNVEEGEEELTPKQRNTAARIAFVTTVGDIYSNAISSEVSKGGALLMGKIGRMQPHYDDERMRFQIILKEHVTGKLYGRKLAKPKPKPPANKKANKVAPKDDNGDVHDENGEVKADAVKTEEPQNSGIVYIDDYVSQLDIETYIECRVRPLAETFEKRAPVMSRRYTAAESLSLAANTAGAVLAVLSLGSWVSITVAVSAVFLALQDYFFMPSQLEATNRALQENHNLLNWWESLSLVQRKTRMVKFQCATCCEGALLAICNSRTGVSPVLPGQAGSGDDDEE